jgi:thiamine pyrophosphate-dependent acetolactate synthase large subunit-like protein
MNTSKSRTLIQSVGFGEEKMFIELNNGRVLTVPYNYTKRLSNATIDDLRDYRLIANGIGIHFERIDEDISLEGILRDFEDETKRINISVSATFLDIADKYAKKHHISRSALLQKATLNYINM